MAIGRNRPSILNLVNQRTYGLVDSVLVCSRKCASEDRYEARSDAEDVEKANNSRSLVEVEPHEKKTAHSKGENQPDDHRCTSVSHRSLLARWR